MTEEWKENIRKSRLGKPHPHKGQVFSAETRKKISETKKKNGDKPIVRIGVDMPTWKGESASYATIHGWVKKWRGTPSICEGCGKAELNKRQIHWANKDHRYKRVLDDYIRLCVKCHGQYDVVHNLRKHRE